MSPDTGNSTSLPSEQITSLKKVLHDNDFLQLISSSEQYPGSQGSGLPLLRLQTPLCHAVIALQGAQLLEFSTANGKPLLWLSPNCNFSAGTALRGGVPVCLPWFGPHPTDPKKPKHGFARNQPWQLNNAALLSDGTAELTFAFNSPANELFAFNFSAELSMTLGNTVKLAITVTNNDTQAFDCSWVLHSYYKVNSLNTVRVQGLAGRTYLDNLENHAEKYQQGDVDFPYEVDRVFPDIKNDLTIVNESSIAITHHNCPSVVVWNPGAGNAAKMADVGAGNEQQFICVERGAVMQERWNLKAGESESAWVELREI